jgi:protein-S-isoprenylcysteine O-methyltransferase Ste14
MGSKRRRRYLQAWKQHLRRHSFQQWLFILAVILLPLPLTQTGIPASYSVWIKQAAGLTFIVLLILMMWQVRDRYYERGEQSFEQVLQQKYGVSSDTAANIADDARELVGDAPAQK